jgi:hypothetical protein
MKESSLSCGTPEGVEVYRFLWLRSFHHPIAVRIMGLAEGGARLVAVELTGAGGYEPGHILQRIERSLGDSEWQGLQRLLDATDFWKMPTQPVQPDLGVDGAQWIVEGRRLNEYHVVDRFMPREKPYRSLGLAFVMAAGIHVPEEEIY